MRRAGPPRRARPAAASVLLAAGCAALALALGWIVMTLEPAPGLAPIVAANLHASGVRSGVTGVLLNFRAFDTMLEVAVLVAAVVAIWSLERGRPATPPPISSTAEPVLALLLRAVVPLIVMAVAYLVWRGSHAPGGAFQGGALLGGAAVLLLAAGRARAASPAAWTVRVLVCAGLLGFLLLAAATLVAQGGLLQYPPGMAYVLIVALEFVLAVSIAAILAALFVDVPAVRADAGHEPTQP